METKDVNGNSQENPILLFDGVCNLCDGAVQFIIKRDKQAVFRFASLQSNIGQEILQKYNLSTNSLDTVVLIKDGKAYTRSSAALHTLKELGGFWSIGFIFIIIPKGLRDVVYDWIARNRYKWFGKQDACMIPTPDLRNRFLDQ